MDRGFMFVMVILVLIVIGVCLFISLSSALNSVSGARGSQTLQPPRPRIILPTDKKIYTFTIDSELKSEEWEIILNAGWSFINCTTEQCKEYVGCYPDAPSYNKTYWHYVFRKN